MVFPQELYSGDYFFVYASDENNVVVFIQTTPESADTPENDMPDYEVFDTMVDDILEAIELKNVHMYDDSDSRCGEEHEMDDDT